jgi:5-methylcytosine-specific restriction protein A
VLGGGKCERHRLEAQRDSDARRPSARERGYDERWAATRKAFLLEHPYCEDESGCDMPAVDVDHIDGQGPLGRRGHDHINLRALCKSHHSQRTARDQPGGWNR